MKKKRHQFFLGSLLVDIFAMASIAGIYPRYIEPKRLTVKNLRLDLHPKVRGMRLVHLSDLHFHARCKDAFLKKIYQKVTKLKPDVIVFTGDFICYSMLEDKARLLAFLKAFKAPLGNYCTFGNHDYATYVTRNLEGLYDTREALNPIRGLATGIKCLFSKPSNLIGRTKRVQSIQLHEQLVDLLSKTSFQILENKSIIIEGCCNLVGLGDHGAGRANPDIAFRSYCDNLPGIVLSHNPDAFSYLMRYPGDLILSGHSHGEQIHFPFPQTLRKISRKLARLENPAYTRGLIEHASKKMFVTNGLGAHKPFRFCSPPQIAVFDFI